MIDIKKLKDYCNPLSILYVEDDEVLHKSVFRYLSQLFKNVDSALNGDEGLNLYKSNKYDIVLTDIKMPKIDGLKMTEAIKEINSEQEVIILSAHTEADFFLTAIHLEVSEYILKPIMYEQMNSTLYKVSKRIHHLKENMDYRNNLEKLVKEQTKLITDNYEYTLIAMVDMIESRDSYTGGHSKRVAEYSKLIAQEMNLSENECNLVYKAGMLHDIGKVTTPDTILLKPGQLSEKEYVLIQNHVEVSHQLLSRIPMYEELSDIVLHHHERYDGFGYPSSIKADEIPLLSHIMIIADSFDAMTTNRIYKGRKSIEEAISEIKLLSSKQFHPDVVPFACTVLSQININEIVSQFPITTVEQERFSYFFHDTITDSFNEDYLHFILKQDDKLSTLNICVCFLKNLSQYNNTLGWTAGNLLLLDFSIFLQKHYPEAMIFRIHGDEFIVISENLYFEEYMKHFEESIKNNDIPFLELTGVTVDVHLLDINDDIFNQIEKLDSGV